MDAKKLIKGEIKNAILNQTKITNFLIAGQENPKNPSDSSNELKITFEKKII